jgi:beta-exotoxin I transport system ATP-binding protein
MMAAMVTPVVETHGLSKHFGDTVALEHLDLEVAPGTVFGFLGPNGAGKTTTIRLLMGLHRATAGTGRVLGLDAWRARDEIHRRAGYLPGDFVAPPRETVGDYLAFLGTLRDGVDPSVTARLADRLALDPARRIGTLSRGNRQKVGIVQAFMHRPEVLVLDEPTSGLDPLMQRGFREIVAECRDEGRTVFLSSHVLGEVEQIADTVGILRAGRLVVVEGLEHLKERARREVELVFRGPVPEAALRAAVGVHSLEVVGARARLVIEGPMDDVFRVAAPAGIENVVAEEAPLEQILLGYYGSER